MKRKLFKNQGGSLVPLSLSLSRSCFVRGQISQGLLNSPMFSPFSLDPSIIGVIFLAGNAFYYALWTAMEGKKIKDINSSIKHFRYKCNPWVDANIFCFILINRTSFHPSFWGKKLPFPILLTRSAKRKPDKCHKPFRWAFYFQILGGIQQKYIWLKLVEGRTATNSLRVWAGHHLQAISGSVATAVRFIQPVMNLPV